MTLIYVTKFQQVSSFATFGDVMYYALVSINYSVCHQLCAKYIMFHYPSG